LKVIRKDSPPSAFTKIPDLADINTIDSGASVLPVGVDVVDISDDKTIKTALTSLLPVIGYDAKKAPIFLKKSDIKIPAAAAKPLQGYWAINIETGNAWTINEYKPAPVAEYGGKKRKTNRRKHRRSNRKTLGRKK
jgi:cobalamin-dependent methionine synthase I